MRISTNRILPLVLAGALALLSFWLDRLVRDDEIHPSLRRHDPDYVIEGFLLRSFNPQGTEIGTLTGARMVHYPDDDSTELEGPRIIDQKPGRARLTLTAGRATMNQSGDEVFLQDRVRIVREALDNAPESTMTTSFLHYVRARALLRTDREVRVEERGRSLVGGGMEYEHDTHQLRLLNGVQGRFDKVR